MVNVGDVKKALKSPGLGEALGGALVAILDLWMTDGARGAKELASALDDAAKQMENKEDALIKNLNVLERKLLWSAVHPFKLMKESARNAGKAEAETEAKAEAGT